MILNKFSDFYKRFEKYISPIGLIYGFIFTSLTLTRVDKWLENFWIVVHLLIVAGGITVLTLYENRAEKRNIPEDERQRFHFYLTLIIQFAFGGLFSTFFIFYMRSSSFFQSWLFLLILAILLIGNELWKKHYSRLAFQISVFFVSIYLFLIFLLPVLMHRLGDDLFLASGIISLIIIVIFLFLLKKIAQERFKQSHNIIKNSIIGIFVLMNILYFTNIIPPIPLSLKDSGAYHKIVKVSQGKFEAQAEPANWMDNFVRYPVFHTVPGELVYAFSAIFSPVNFGTEIVHQWQYYDDTKNEWINSSRIILPIIGGRDGGFRTYSIKQGLTAGLWRVKVTNPRGQVIGRINLKVEVGEPRPTYPQVLN